MGLGLRVRDLGLRIEGLRFEVCTSCRLRDVLAEDFRYYSKIPRYPIFYLLKGDYILDPKP